MSPQLLNFDAFYPFIRKRSERTRLADDVVKARPIDVDGSASYHLC